MVKESIQNRQLEIEFPKDASNFQQHKESHIKRLFLTEVKYCQMPYKDLLNTQQKVLSVIKDQRSQRHHKKWVTQSQFLKSVFIRMSFAPIVLENVMLTKGLQKQLHITDMTSPVEVSFHTILVKLDKLQVIVLPNSFCI